MTMFSCNKRLLISCRTLMMSPTVTTAFRRTNLPEPEAGAIPLITTPTEVMRKAQRKKERKLELLHEYEKFSGVNPSTSRLKIKCSRSEFNHYDGQRYKHGQVPLVSQYWAKSKYKNDYFILNASLTKKPYFDDALASSFGDLGESVGDAIVENLGRLKVHRPTVIQCRAFSAFNSARHLVLAAETGSGKTIAFAAPVLTDLIRHKTQAQRVCKGFFLTPTRELCLQLGRMLRDLVIGTDVCVDVPDSARGVVSDADVIVATPGILADILEQEDRTMWDIRFVVMDEADKLLGDPFVSVLTRIFERVRLGRVGMDENANEVMLDGSRLVLSLATLPMETKSLLSSLIADVDGSVYFVTTEHLHRLPGHVSQKFIRVRQDDKLDTLVEILRKRKAQATTIVFCNDRDTAVWLTKQLEKRMSDVTCLCLCQSTDSRHSRFHSAFVEGQVSVIVATDLISRGIDTKQVSCVINYDMPDRLTDYMHRLGRTGRCGSAMSAQLISFVRSKKDVQLTNYIEGCARLNRRLTDMEIDSNDYNQNDQTRDSSGFL